MEWVPQVDLWVTAAPPRVAGRGRGNTTAGELGGSRNFGFKEMACSNHEHFLCTPWWERWDPSNTNSLEVAYRKLCKGNRGFSCWIATAAVNQGWEGGGVLLPWYLTTDFE